MMKKLFLLFPVLLMLAACEQLDLQPLEEHLDPLPEALASLKKETAEDLGLTKTQATQLHKGLALHANLHQKPGYLWLVARHLHENLPHTEKAQLLKQISMIEEHLLQNGQCIPLGLEVNQGHPIGLRPELIAPILVAPQQQAFKIALQQYQNRAEELVKRRINDQITPQQFFGAMQSNFNILMQVIIGEILLPPQREQLVEMLKRQITQREQYILKSYECMAPALGLVEEEVRTIVMNVMTIESQKQGISEDFHTGDISMEEAILLIQSECGNYFGNLEAAFDEGQLEITRIYRALAFRPRG